MQTLFTTRGAPARSSFKLWRDVLREQFVPSELTPLGDRPFEGTIGATVLGGLPIAQVTVDALKTEVTASTIRRHAKSDTLGVMVFLEGSSNGEQYGREAGQRPGDIVLYDSTRPAVMAATDTTTVFLLEVPRRRMEEALGPARLYSSLTLDGTLGATSLATTYLKELVRVQGGLDADTAARMSSIGLDLLTAAFAQQMARDVPRSIQGDVNVQRAKAYVQANIGDPRLDPERVAAAVGLSLRRLQELFQERDRSIADWTWERRLERAAGVLADPACLHLPIGTVAFDCGFASQAHFTNRFRRRFDLPPREYRIRALLAPSKH